MEKKILEENIAVKSIEKENLTKTFNEGKIQKPNFPKEVLERISKALLDLE